MSHFKAKMQQIRFPLGLSSRASWGSLQRSPDSLAVFNVPTSKWTEGKGGEEGRGRKGKGEGRGVGGRRIWPTEKFWRGAPYETNREKNKQVNQIQKDNHNFAHFFRLSFLILSLYLHHRSSLDIILVN